jgi:hypothetical protein
MVVVPLGAAVRVTTFPPTGFEYLSFNVTEIVAGFWVPVAKTPGAAVIVQLAATTAPAVKVTAAVGVMEMLSVESVALNVAVSAAVEETVKVTLPVALELPEAAPIVVLAGVEASVTVFPDTGFPSLSVNVTVIVLVAVPLAAMGEALAVTEDLVGETTPVTKLIVAVAVRVRLSVESVAVSFKAPTVVAVTGKVTCPLDVEVPEAEPIVKPIPVVVELPASLTVFRGTGFPYLSSRVTVTVLTVAPSAGTVVGLTLTVDTDAETGPAANMTDTPLVIAI